MDAISNNGWDDCNAKVDAKFSFFILANIINK